MDRRFLLVALALTVISSLAISGCKARVDRPAVEEEYVVESVDIGTPSGSTLASQAEQPVVEPAMSVAVETIPPTAAAQSAVEKTASRVVTPLHDRSKEIQTALKNAGFYDGKIDGKVGPKTKKAIRQFQEAKGLKVDGKVGPKTWAELERYLLQ